MKTPESMVSLGRSRHRRQDKNISTSAVLFFLVRCTTALSGSVVIVLMSRSLGVAEFGVFSLALTLTTLGATISDAGLNSLLAREAINQPNLEYSLLKWGMLVRLFTGLISAAIFGLVGFIMASDSSDTISIIFVVATLPLLGVTVNINAMSRRFLLGRVAALTLVQSVVWLASVIALSSIGASLLSYAIAYFLGTIVYVLLAFMLSRSVIPKTGTKLNLAEAWNYLRSAIPLGVSAVLTMGYSKIGGVLLFAFWGAEVSAGFSLSYRLIDQLALIPMTIAMIYGPLLNYRIRDGHDAGELVTDWTRVTLVVSVGASTFSVANADFIINRVFGSRYADSVTLLQILSPTFVLICLGWILTPVAIAYRKSRTQLKVSAVCLTLNVTLNLIFIPLFGATAAAIITFVTELIVVSGLYTSLKSSGSLVLPSRRIVGKLVILVAAMSVPSLFLHGFSGLIATLIIFFGCVTSLKMVTKADLTMRAPASLTAK